MAKSIEPNIADLANGWLKDYGLDYKLEQEELNSEIDNALEKYESKGGGKGGNRPDAKLIIKNSSGQYYPILIEYKGKKDDLEKLNEQGYIDNINKKYESNFTNIKKYAVNGAIHYANALLHYTSYSEIIAIGMTGYRDEQGDIQHKIAVYYVSGKKGNYGVGCKIDEYDDFSFLKKENFDAFIKKAKSKEIPQEIQIAIKHEKEQEIDKSLTTLNNEIYIEEKGLGEETRMYLVFSAILATLDNKDNISISEKNSKIFNDKKLSGGEVILNKIKEFLSYRKLPQRKKEFVIKILTVILLDENINRVENGESQLKRVFIKIIDQIGIYYKIGLTTDFTGKLFNEMYNWLGFSQDKLNDVVLTPTYVSTLLVKLARVNKDSFVWDFATGSAGLLIASMNEMLEDAKRDIKSPDKLRQKEVEIKSQQLLGIEILPEIYMLAILNMILMGDGSSNILNEDSIKDFKNKENFPADAFILNPPYSANGNGMNFVEKALSMMNRGYGAIIIQNSAGSGKATEYNKRILEKHTLIASIKMPVDIFIGKSNVNTNIYVFKVGEPHHKDDTVKFIDFSNDGYTRSNRKKASNNLKDTDRAKDRYNELVDLVRFGKRKLSIFTEKEYYEGTIDPTNGNDWNQSAPIDTKPTLEDFKKTVSDYLAWEVTNIIKQRGDEGK